jgi:signal transduction histidine kinase
MDDSVSTVKKSAGLAGLAMSGALSSLCLAIFIWVFGEYLSTEYFDFNIYRALDLDWSETLALISLVLGEYLFFIFFKNYILRWISNKSSFKIKSLIAMLGIIPGWLLNQLTCSICEWWIFIGLNIGIYLAFYLINWYRESLFHSSLLIIILGASLNASVAFWLHEESNRGMHLQYAKQLSEPRDSFAEKDIIKMVQQSPPIVPKGLPEEDLFAYWEKIWMESPYLSSNYELRITSCNIDSTQILRTPFLTVRADEVPEYRVYFRENYCLHFKLNKATFKSVYLPLEPYKEMERLSDFNYAVFSKGKIIRANSHDFDLGLEQEELPKVGTWEKIEKENYDAIVFRKDAKTYVMIGEPLSEVLVWISNFTFQFSLFLILITFLRISRWFLQGNPKDSWRRMPIQSRIQITIFAMVFMLFLIISAGTLLFLNRNNNAFLKESQLMNAENLKDELEEELDRLDWEIKQVSADFLKEYASRNLRDIDIYDLNGKLIASSHASAVNSLAPSQIPEADFKPALNNPSSILIGKNKKGNNFSLFAIGDEGTPQGFVITSSPSSNIGTAHDIPVIIADFLNIYIFLMFFAWGVGLLLISILTRPLNLLAKRLRLFELGQVNEKLEWEGNDTIGQLIQDYNGLVEKLDANAKELAKAEREGAWKMMAQQIAHEINNPLTPLKLNIQYLTYAFGQKEGEDKERLDRITDGLLEQVDRLSKIAGQFNLFARMDTPELQKLHLDKFLEEFMSEYQEGTEVSYDLEMCFGKENSPIIKVDPSHFGQVLKHLIQNGIQSLDGEKRGLIKLKAYTENEVAIIEVSDNGSGIPEAMQSKLFEPSFSTKSSGTGLGLAVSRKIIEFFNGSLSFSTEEGTGTTFIISLPVQS